MSKVLYINANPKKEDYSFSRRAGKYYQERLHQEDSQLELDVLDVYNEYIPLIDGDVLEAWGALQNGSDFSDLSDEQQEKVGRMGSLLKRFKEADAYVFVTPLWNLSIPPMLKAFIDNVMIAGETFKYTEQGPVGLLADKKATVIQASGGVYSQGPAAAMEHGTNYLEAVLSFMGVRDIKVIQVEGIAIPGKSDEERLNEVYSQIDDLLEPEYV